MTGENVGGRPSVLTPEVQRKLLAGLRCGLSRAAAATRAGVGARTLREWMARTDAAEPYASLRAEVEAVEADCEARLTASVFKAALADPNQARWLLERRFPQRWAKRPVEPKPEAEAPSVGGFSKFLRRAEEATGVASFLRPKAPQGDETASYPPWRKKASQPQG